MESVWLSKRRGNNTIPLICLHSAQRRNDFPMINSICSILGLAHTLLKHAYGERIECERCIQDSIR